ncbi:hypothetical protein Tco_1242676, partial [Tanacetum coccineum]
ENLDAATLRTKPSHHYDELVEFAKDKATGEASETAKEKKIE